MPHVVPQRNRRAHCRNVTFEVLAVSPERIYVLSSAVACVSGSRYTADHTTAATHPTTRRVMNIARHPNPSIGAVRIGGASAFPMLGAAEVQAAIGSPRRLTWNQLLTTRAAV